MFHQAVHTRLLMGGLLLSLALGGLSEGWATTAAPKKPVTAPVTIAAPKSEVTLASTPCVVKDGTATVACSGYAAVTPLDLVKKPASYLGKAVQFEAEFNSYSTLGLDYSRAKRDSRDYYGLMVRRPDVTHHVIPLSELKLFAKRPDEDKEPGTVAPAGAKSKKPPVLKETKDTAKDTNERTAPLGELSDWLALERGDRVLVYGKVFAAALDDPWMDVQRIDILKKAPPKKKKSTAANTSPKP